MAKISRSNWESVTVSPATVIEKIKPGMSIFLGTAVAEPRTMVRHLINSDAKNLEDIELIETLTDAFSVAGDKVDAREINVDLLMLPPSEQVHGG